MRRQTLAAVAALCVLGVTATAGAAPMPPQHDGGAPALILVRGGCGPGFHRHRWVDRFGRLHVSCVPNRPVYSRCGPGWHWARWIDRFGRRHARCVPNR